MFEDDGTIPPNLRRVPDDPHWRCFKGAQVSKADPEAAPPFKDFAVVPVNSELVASGAQTDLYRRAAQCWDHLKQTDRDTWEHYIVIGKAMVAARAEIMRKLDRNSPTGPAYQREFKAWLVEYRLADMDKGARARLIRLIDALPEVNELLSSWSDQDRRKKNHPNTIYRELQKWRDAQGQPTETRTKKPIGTGRKELLQENERLRAHIADIEAARECETVSAATATDPPEPTDIMIEAIVSRSRKKMTPSAAWRAAEHAERKRRERLKNTVFQISCVCENNEELELPTLTAAERDDAVAKLEASAIDLNKLIGRLKAAPIHE